MPETNTSQDVGLYTTSEVEARTGVPATTLRQWERRYGTPRPERNASGYRLYSQQDLFRIEYMLAQMHGGVAISRAAELARERFSDEAPAPTRAPLLDDLRLALLAPDHVRAAELLAQAHAQMPVESVLTDVIAPVLHDIGMMWERGEITVAHEHQASAFLRARVVGLLDAAGQGDWGPSVVAACAPGEHHEIGLLMLAVVLRRQGMRVHYLGANTPLADLAVYARQVRADAILISANSEVALQALRAERRDLQDGGFKVFYGGATFNARPELAVELGGQYAGSNAVGAARHIGALLRPPM